MNKYLEKISGQHHHVYKWMKENHPEKLNSKKDKKSNKQFGIKPLKKSPKIHDVK